MKHSPLIRLQTATARWNVAQQECPHWDYENEPDAGCPCCEEYHEAKEERRHAFKAWQKAEQGRSA